MKRIKCTLSTLSKAIESLADYKRVMKERNQLFLTQLAQIGIDLADVRFGTAIYDGYNDVHVLSAPFWISSNKVAVRASGHSITFIEFGSGVHYSAPVHPLASEFGYERGEYGYHLGRFDSWRYTGIAGTNGQVIESGRHAGEILTHGNPANMCMYTTAKDMRNKILEIAKECYPQ